MSSKLQGRLSHWQACMRGRAWAALRTCHCKKCRQACILRLCRVPIKTDSGGAKAMYAASVRALCDAGHLYDDSHNSKSSSATAPAPPAASSRAAPLAAVARSARAVKCASARVATSDRRLWCPTGAITTSALVTGTASEQRRGPPCCLLHSQVHLRAIPRLSMPPEVKPGYVHF